MVNAYNTITGKNDSTIYSLSSLGPVFIDNTIVHGEYTKGKRDSVT